MAKREDMVIGLDIGTTKICAIVGERVGDGIDVVGIGTHPSKGLRKGVVVNIESTVQSIQKAIEEAELMAGCEIGGIYAGIAGGHIRSVNSHGVIAIKDREVREGDIRRVIDAARAISMPLDREVIHIFPQEFVIDDQDGIKEPLGMSGVRLEAKVHIVTGAVASAQNIIKCANRAGLNVSDIVLQSYASSEAVLTPEEKEVGAAIVDIGGGTTDIAVFYGGNVKHTAELTLGGDHITWDVGIGLRTPPLEAEKIKKKFGCAMTSLVKRDEAIDVPSIGGRRSRSLARALLAEIIEPRVEEILNLVRAEIDRSGHRDLLASGVVLTGGTSLLEGIVELAEQVLDLPVRRGVPQGIGGLVDVVNSPAYATGVGLVLYGAKHMNGHHGFRIREGDIFDKVRRRMAKWFKEFF